MVCFCIAIVATNTFVTVYGSHPILGNELSLLRNHSSKKDSYVTAYCVFQESDTRLKFMIILCHCLCS